MFMCRSKCFRKSGVRLNFDDCLVHAHDLCVPRAELSNVSIIFESRLRSGKDREDEEIVVNVGHFGFGDGPAVVEMVLSLLYTKPIGGWLRPVSDYRS